MSINTISNLMRDGIIQVLKLTLPVLGFAVGVGLVVAIFQATTSIQEQTLTFVPKMLAIFIALMLCGAWMLDNMSGFMTDLWSKFSYYLSMG